MNADKTTIGVIGHTGMVGSVVYSYFLKKGYRVYGVSKSSSQSNTDKGFRLINQADMIFICVTTSFLYTRNKPDFSSVKEVIQKIKPAKTVVIKSTILPGTTDTFQRMRPDLFLLFNPEFISRKTAQADFQRPIRQIIGYTKTSKAKAADVLNILPKGTYSALMKASEAELVKYAHNIFGALSVVYANHLFDVCQKKDLDYEKIIQAFTALKGMEQFRRYATIYHNHKRGFGGPCFPKDINSFLTFCDSMGVQVELIKAARNANKRILASQGLTEYSVEAY